MKNITLLLLTFLFISTFTNVHCQKPVMELTFSAESNNGQYIPLSSVEIENLTQGGDTTLYAPDTILSLEYSLGVEDFELSKKSFSVSQNYPNPFSNQTKVDVCIPKKDDIDIVVLNILGSQVAAYKGTLNPGIHEFIFQPGKEKYYILLAKSSNETRAIKMVSLNSGRQSICNLVYNGQDDLPLNLKSNKVKSGFVFDLGDQLNYTAYSFLGESSIIDSPTNNKSYTFNFVTAQPCPGTPTITYEGQVYNTILIGNQCWFKENLNVGVTNKSVIKCKLQIIISKNTVIMIIPAIVLFMEACINGMK